MILSTDQTGRSLQLKTVPERIISLVPSQTELLFDLGLEKSVIGITKFCIHPHNWFREKERIGGTKNVNLEKVRRLQPDLIIANKEENEKSQIDQLASEFPVWTSSITNVQEALEMIAAIGTITNTANRSRELIDQIKTGFSSLHLPSLNQSCLYLIWRDPFMSAGTDTFIHSVLQFFGLDTVPLVTRYPVVSPEEIEALHPDFIFLSSEPYPFKEKHITELKQLSPQSRVILVDGEMFSWYGSRMLKMPEYFTGLYKQIKQAL